MEKFREFFKHIFQQYDKREVGIAYLYLLPGLLIIIAFVLAPVIGTFINSLYRDISYAPLEFVGFSNYADALTNPDFWSAFRFTLLFTIASVALEAVFGMAFALVLNDKYPLRGLLRTVILIPWAIPTIISAKTWQFMYDYSYGLFNWLFLNTGLADEKINFIGNATTAFWSLVFTDVWKTTPFMVIILLAGLQAIPEDVYKQAKIDGSGMFRSFWKITLPLVRPVLAITLIFRTIDALRIFDLVYALTGGGPASTTETLSMIGYKYFVSDGDFGMGSTISIITFIVAFLITLLYVRVGNFGKK
jgi:multiple sugar transport system permease protein